MSLILYQTGKSATFRRINFQETSISRHHEGPIEGLSEASRPIAALLYSDIQGGLIGPPLCRETLVSWTADVIFFQSCLSVRMIVE